MIEGADARASRCAAVWLLASVATATTWWVALPIAARLTTATGWAEPFDALLVRVCAAALLPSTGWLWVVTSSTVLGALRGRPRSGNATRRLVLLACGVAVVAGVAAPATASGEGHRGVASDTQVARTGPPVIAGLTLPDRAVSPARRVAPAAAPATAPRPVGQPAPSPATPSERTEHVVAPGDSLWSVAEAHGTRWQAIWAANRHVIGDDPDLILPGQRLVLPATDDDHRRAR